MSSPATPQVAGAPASQPVFPDEILEEIFVRLDAMEDLARTSAACTTFRRVVSARRFLHRFRCLHPPPVLGFLELDAPGRFHPAEPPHHSAPAARALARATDFTFFFPDAGNRWQVCDARDGRVLLYWRSHPHGLRPLARLHRRRVRLPPITNDLASFSASWGLQLDAFLDPATDTEKEKQDLSFRVICIAKNLHNIVTFHFSSATGKWRGITLHNIVTFHFSSATGKWRGITLPVPLGPDFSFRVFRRYYAHGCFFWRTGKASTFMVMLNMHDMKISVVDLPPGTNDYPQQAIVEAGEGTIGLVTICVDRLQLYSKSLQGTDWHHERIVPLPKLNCYWNIHNAAAGYLLIQAAPIGSFLFAKQEPQYFTLNLKTFLVERLCIPDQYIEAAHLYASFLLPFSQPSI